MKKYMGLIVLTALAGGVGVAVKAAPDGKQTGRGGSDVGDVQVAQLDKRLSARITEQQELMGIVERLLHMNFQPKIQGSIQEGNVLSGLPKPPVAPVPVQLVKKTEPMAAPAAPPWWVDYKLQMVYGSGADRYAVVNGKMVTRGQSVGKDVQVDSLTDDSVVLRLGNEYHTYMLKK